VILGGYAGGPAGVAVVCAAYHPVGILVIRGVVQHPLAVPIEGGTTSTRGIIWARSVAIQAATRNSPLSIVAPGYTSAGPMTEMCYQEFAAWVMAIVVSGGSVEVGPPSKGIMEDYSDPLENIFSNAVAHASAGMSRKEANTIVFKLLEGYEDKLKDPPLGKKLPDYFDIASGTPNKECIEFYRKMRQEFTGQFGLKLPLTSPYL
jgi:methylamine--corrinoid protein Co-methyltransferase